jgi:hypothetical protein
MSTETINRVNSAPTKICDAMTEVRGMARDELLWVVEQYRQLCKANEHLALCGLRVVRVFETLGRTEDAAQLLIEKQNCEKALVALEAALKSTV